MIIKVTGVVAQDFRQHSQEQTRQTKFYRPEQPKQTIKQDFNCLLDQEIEKLHFEKFI